MTESERQNVLTRLSKSPSVLRKCSYRHTTTRIITVQYTDSESFSSRDAGAVADVAASASSAPGRSADRVCGREKHTRDANKNTVKKAAKKLSYYDVATLLHADRVHEIQNSTPGEHPFGKCRHLRHTHTSQSAVVASAAIPPPHPSTPTYLVLRINTW